MKTEHRTSALASGYRGIARMMRAAPLPRGKRYLANLLGRALIDPAHAPTEIATVGVGVRMRLDLADPFQRQLYFAGVYDPAVTRLFTRILRPGDVAIDGGANIGYYSLLSARCVGPGGHVHAFEPTPHAFARLRDNIDLNGFTEIRASQKALWSEATTLILEIPRSEDGTRGVEWAATIARMDRGEQVEVQACTLDSYVGTYGIERIRLVKLDVEGAEAAVIDGMSRVLDEQRVDYLIGEINTFLLDALGRPHDELVVRMRAHGYRGYAIDDHRRLREIGSAAPSALASGDYLFVRAGLSEPG